MHASVQSTKFPSWQNCGCKGKSSVRPSCGLTTVCLTPVLDHSDITAHAEPCCFEQETPSRNCGLVAICTYFFLSSLMHCPSPFLMHSLHLGFYFFPRWSLAMSPGMSLALEGASRVAVNSVLCNPLPSVCRAGCSNADALHVGFICL